nr:uncharacterized protein LOC110089052 isoform X3 [Pogona vitticeps]
MMALFLLLLTMALGLKNVHSLDCYRCNVTTYSGCTYVVNCSETQKFCTRYTSTTTSGFVLQQGCAERCPIVRGTWPKLYTFTCCQESRCNGVAGIGRYSSALIMITVLRALS